MVLAVISSELFWPPFVQPLSVRLSTLFWFHRPRSFRKGGIMRWSNSIGHDQICHEVVILELITSAVFDHLKIFELKGSLNTNISNKTLGGGGGGLRYIFQKLKCHNLYIMKASRFIVYVLKIVQSLIHWPRTGPQETVQIEAFLGILHIRTILTNPVQRFN